MNYEHVCANPADYTEAEILFTLSELDDAYYGSGTPLVSDEAYDRLYRHAERFFPGNIYFRGVGSDKRGGKVPLPMTMGGLNQVHLGEFDGWVSKNGVGKELAVISDKLDGYSAMITYGPNGRLRMAFSRGNGTEGADITRHLRKMKVPTYFSEKNAIVRGEIIILKKHFPRIQAIYKKDDGSEYKNARNMVAGIMNSKTAGEEAYQYLTFVAYSVMNSDKSKTDQLRLLEAYFPVPAWTTAAMSSLSEEWLIKTLIRMREDAPYEMDGIVIDVDGPEARSRLGSGNDLKPEYAVKFKVADETNDAVVTVTGVEWNVSKHGYLKPTVLLEPVELVGVTVKRASGYNAKFIQDNGIGAGAQIRITRAGDVIPDILEIVKPADADMPTVEWDWNETAVDAVAAEESDEVTLLKMKSFFNSLKVEKLQEASIAKLMDRGMETIEDIIRLDRTHWISILGVNGEIAYNSLHKKLQDVELWELMGAWPYFYRGFGQTRAKSIVDAMGFDALSASADQISAIAGFDDKTAARFEEAIDDFLEFYSSLEAVGLINVRNPVAKPAQSSGDLLGKKFAFTGFRDAELEEKIRARGGEVQDGVKKDTTHLVAKDTSKSSNKLQKAAEKGIAILSRDELLQLLA